MSTGSLNVLIHESGSEHKLSQTFQNIGKITEDGQLIIDDSSLGFIT